MLICYVMLCYVSLDSYSGLPLRNEYVALLRQSHTLPFKKGTPPILIATTQESLKGRIAVIRFYDLGLAWVLKPNLTVKHTT